MVEIPSPLPVLLINHLTRAQAIQWLEEAHYSHLDIPENEDPVGLRAIAGEPPGYQAPLQYPKEFFLVVACIDDPYYTQDAGITLLTPLSSGEMDIHPVITPYDPAPIPEEPPAYTEPPPITPPTT